VDQNQSSQKYNAAAWMHEHVSILVFVLIFFIKIIISLGKNAHKNAYINHFNYFG
jgi:hypothetical protein